MVGASDVVQPWMPRAVRDKRGVPLARERRGWREAPRMRRSRRIGILQRAQQGGWHMRVVECDICGETISAASDDELVGRVSDHLESEHDQEASEDEVRTMVDKEAYEAMDS